MEYCVYFYYIELGPFGSAIKGPSTFNVGTRNNIKYFTDKC